MGRQQICQQPLYDEKLSCRSVRESELLISNRSELAQRLSLLCGYVRARIQTEMEEHSRSIFSLRAGRGPESVPRFARDATNGFARRLRHSAPSTMLYIACFARLEGEA